MRVGKWKVVETEGSSHKGPVVEKQQDRTESLSYLVDSSLLSEEEDVIRGFIGYPFT